MALGSLRQVGKIFSRGESYHAPEEGHHGPSASQLHSQEENLLEASSTEGSMCWGMVSSGAEASLTQDRLTTSIGGCVQVTQLQAVWCQALARTCGRRVSDGQRVTLGDV